MPTITLRLELHQPTQAKQEMYQHMTQVNTEFANWLLLHLDLHNATSKIFKEFSVERLPSAVVNQTIREVRAQKKKQWAKTRGVPLLVAFFRPGGGSWEKPKTGCHPQIQKQRVMVDAGFEPQNQPSDGQLCDHSRCGNDSYGRPDGDP